MVKQSEEGLSRRRTIQLLGVGASAGLAGCGGENNSDSGDGGGDSGGDGDDGGGSQELGERVPGMTLMFHNGAPESGKMETMAPELARDITKALDYPVEILNPDFSRAIDNAIEDQRNYDFYLIYHSSTPDRLDPHPMTRRFAIDAAGGDGRGNLANYASCEYSVPAVKQASAPDEQTRRELVNKALSAGSQDIMNIPVLPRPLFSVIRSDVIEPKGLGKIGLNLTNPNPFIKSNVKKGGVFKVQTSKSTLETANYLTMSSAGAIAVWSHLVYSTLYEFNENYELKKLLARSHEIENDGKTITVELKDDITFHDGTPITADDVRFTFKLLWDNAGAFPQAYSTNYDSIEVIDENTTQFKFSESFLPLVTRVWPRWGIYPKHHWEKLGAHDDPEGFTPDPIIGSGPFQVRDFEQGQSLNLNPFKHHPVYSPDHDLFLRGFEQDVTAVNAFMANEIHAVLATDVGNLEQIKNNLSEDQYREISRETVFPFLMYPSYAKAPAKFREFRDAIGKAINRQKAIDLVANGEVEPTLHSCQMAPNHPWRPPNDMLYKFTDQETGDRGAARQALKDEGWGWDDKGNLRYPADADLAPLWPKGEQPDPADFPCLSNDQESVLTE